MHKRTVTVKDVLKVVTEKARAILQFTSAIQDLTLKNASKGNEASGRLKVQPRFTGTGKSISFNCKNLQKAFANII